MTTPKPPDPVTFSRTDHDLIHHAMRRGTIVLDNGCRCTLVAWRPPGRRTYMRVEFRNGNTATLRIDQLASAVDMPERTRHAR